MPDDLQKIPDSAGLLRRVHPAQIILDHNTGRRRLSSGAFSDPRMSVDVEPMLIAKELDWRFSVAPPYTDYSLVRLRAGIVRAHGQIVEHAPVPTNDCHAEVVGKKSGAVRKALQAAAEWVKKPADVD
jgi:hypothetical protein